MLIDAHAHLDRYDAADWESALDEIRQHHILTVSVSMDLPSYQRALEIGEQCELVMPTLGVHPWNASQHADHLDNLREAIAASPVLGEIGLDYYLVEDRAQYPLQREVLEFFLAAAREYGKIVNLHTKGAEADVLHLLSEYEIDRAIIHWYSGPLDVFQKLAARGCYFTLGVEVLRSNHIQAIARAVPTEQLLTETDNPGGGRWLTGAPGMPTAIQQVVKALATLRGTSSAAIERTVQDNLLRLTEDDPWVAKWFDILSFGV